MEEALNIIDFWSFYDENYEDIFIDEEHAKIAVEKAFYSGKSSVKIKPLNWTKVFSSEKYNYVTAETPIGDCEIRWKYSREYSEEFEAYLVEFHILNEIISATLMCVEFDIDGVTRMAQELLEYKIKNCLVLK